MKCFIISLAVLVKIGANWQKHLWRTRSCMPYHSNTQSVRRWNLGLWITRGILLRKPKQHNMQRKPTFCWEKKQFYNSGYGYPIFLLPFDPRFYIYIHLRVHIYRRTHTYVYIFQSLSMFLSLSPVVFLNDLQNTVGK